MIKIYLLGNPLIHSISPEIHKNLGQYDYFKKELPYAEAMDFIKKKNYDGLNITIPYKMKSVPLMDELSAEAKLTGAVNTVVNRDGKLYGYNTDYFGFAYLIDSENIVFTNSIVYILGQGGAANTVEIIAKERGAKTVIKFSRSEITAGIEGCADILINCTPVGTFPNENLSPCDLSKIKNLKAVIDLTYNPLRTNLLIQAEKFNLKAVNGLKMLIAQATEASKLFNNNNLNDDIIEDIYRKTLTETRNIVLIGMGGAGKSTVGRKIAELTARRFIDTDQLIEEKFGKKANVIIKDAGENYFRSLETKVIEDISNVKNAVISTGGGVVLNSYNIELLKRNGIIVLIDYYPYPDKNVQPHALYPDFITLTETYNLRKPLYRLFADISLFNEHTISVEDFAKEIINEVISR